MGFSLKKDKKDDSGITPQKASANDVMTETELDPFLPYACHYNKSSLLTKNGELLQTIKLTGFNFESISDASEKKISVRAAIRKAIAESIESNDFAIWLHTVRRRTDLSTGGSYEEKFADDLNSAWIDRHDLTHQYMNELYVTILIEGESLSLKSIKNFFRGLRPAKEQAHRLHELEVKNNKLHKAIDNILASLHSFGARRLELRKKDDGIYYSEPLQFLNKIINMEDVPVPVSIYNLADVMVENHKVLFGFNALEVRSRGKERFGAMLTVKEYHEVTSKYIDAFLQLPYSFVITETFDFVNNNKALDFFKKQHLYYTLAKDKEVEEMSGLAGIMASDKGKSTDFGEHQISVLLLDDDLDRVELGIGEMAKAFRDLGIVMFREDLFLEDCFWAQLPGNFDFIKRMSFINTDNIGGYASLYNFPAGQLKGNHWGDAVTVFHTTEKTPYFFNFHYKDNGHTVIIGPYGSGKTVLLNFLLSEARKFRPRLFFIDRGRGSELFINALGGNYLRVLREKELSQVRFNPFRMDDNPENRAFVTEWFMHLITDKPEDISDENKDNVLKAIEYAYSLPDAERKLSNIIPKFWPLEAMDSKKMSEVLTQVMLGDKGAPVSVAERLSIWYGEGNFSHIFDNDEDGIDFSNGIIHAFGVTHMVEDSVTLIPVISYLLHRIRQTLDGSPTILVLDEAWHLIDNPAIAPHIGKWLDEFQQKNAMIIFATESAESAEKSSITNVIMEKMQTSIFLPNPEASDAYIDVFGLSEEEVHFIQTMDNNKRQFMLKHNIDSVVAELSLNGMDRILAILSATSENLPIFEGIISQKGNNPDEWMDDFLERAVK